MISDNSIQEVKSRIDIIDVISDFVDLKKSGSNYKALSPFTTEKTPSFFVSPAKNLFKCFSTGKGGDAISFLQEHEGFVYLDAIRFLANKYGVELKEDQFQDSSEERSEKESLYIVLNFAKELYKTLLWENEVGRSVGLGYFRERGLSDSTIKDFELGFSLPQWDNLIKTAKEKGYNSDILEKAGLIIQKEEGREYDRFRDRTIFPIHNITGRVIGFGARQLITDKKQPKYINSPESEVYNKSKELYGLFQARQHIRNEDRCFLVEGYTDVLSMAQAGVKNVVSSSGTSLTDDQIQLLSRYSKNITVLFDGDPAG
ncbi:MAG: DNA primase, partial [Cyclobacteriaceae bacterium]|nr:DNA primase [Cyclobacteriaceae bacterium]